MLSSLHVLHRAVERLAAILSRVIQWAVFAILLYLVLAVNAAIILRAGLGLSPPWIMDTAQYLAPYLAFFAAAVALGSDSHPKMEFVFNKLSPLCPPRLRGYFLFKVFSTGFSPLCPPRLCGYLCGFSVA